MKGTTMKKFAMFGAAGLLAIGASGCVTTGDLEEVRAMAEQAAQDAADRRDRTARRREEGGAHRRSGGERRG